MRVFRTTLFVITTLFAIAFLAHAQDVRASLVYGRTDFPLVRTGEYEVTENVNSVTGAVNVGALRTGGLRVSLEYDFKYAFNEKVYPDYFDGMKIVDLYRDVKTHSGFVELGYTIRNAIEPFAALGYGTRRIHEDAPRQTVRTFRAGVNVPFKEESPFFLKVYLDFEKPYGKLPAGFINPATRTLGVGAGFRFGGKKSKHAYPNPPTGKLPAGL